MRRATRLVLASASLAALLASVPASADPMQMGGGAMPQGGGIQLGGGMQPVYPPGGVFGPNVYLPGVINPVMQPNLPPNGAGVDPSNPQVDVQGVINSVMGSVPKFGRHARTRYYRGKFEGPSEEPYRAYVDPKTGKHTLKPWDEGPVKIMYRGPCGAWARAARDARRRGDYRNEELASGNYRQCVEAH